MNDFYSFLFIFFIFFSQNNTKGIVYCFLRIPIGSVVQRNEDEDAENLYTVATDYNSQTYGSLSNHGDDDYDDEEFDDIDPEFEENVDSIAPVASKGLKITFSMFPLTPSFGVQ